MKIIFLGTNGWYDTKTGNTSCIFIDSEKYYIILDAGNGIYKIDRLIKSKKPIYLFLSHFHLDHIIGLHILNKFHLRQGLHICGQKGTKKILNKIINKTFTAEFKRLPFKVRFHEFSAGKYFLPFFLECKFLMHVTKCLGYRFKLDDKIITYCTDTAYCKNAIDLARNADLLIAECSYKAVRQDSSWPHLDPLSAAKIAKEARAKKLMLTHFDSEIYQTLAERHKAQIAAKKVFKNTIAAKDNLTVGL